MPLLLLLNAFMLTNISCNKAPDQCMSVLADSHLPVPVLLLFQSPVDFGLFDPFTSEKMEASKILAHQRRQEEEKEERLSNNSS